MTVKLNYRKQKNQKEKGGFSMYEYLMLILMGLAVLPLAAFFSSSEKITIALDEQLMKLVNERLPRNFKISSYLRWCLRAVTMDKAEIEKYCWSNAEEASDIAPFLQETLRKLYEGMPEAKGEACKK
jgi:hypothetical protein